MRLHLFALLSSLVIILGVPAAQRTAPPQPLPELVRPDDLIMAQRGDLPIIISAPHGGVARIAGSKDREKGVQVLDTNTAQLAALVAQRITAKLGRRPYYVIAEFSRKDVDANRPAAPAADDEAFNNPAAQRQYEAYHAALETSVAECRRRWPAGAILIDIHGQAKVPGAIVRGTRNGASMAQLAGLHGQSVIVGPKSIFGVLAAKGYTVVPTLDDPAVSTDDEKETFFNGGYITERYGSLNALGINAIQLEFGRMRTESLEKTARDTGDAVAEFYAAYLAAK